MIDTTYIQGYSDDIIYIINEILLPTLIAVAFIVFLWGVYKYFIQNEAEREKGKTFVLYGIIGFVILFSVWGLVNMVGSTLNLPVGGSPPPVPTFGNK
jgi:predicted PurR-regulated permease PerM